MVAPGGTSALCGGAAGVVIEFSRLELLEHPDKKAPAVVVSRLAMMRRREGSGISADTVVLLRAAFGAAAKREHRQSVILGANS
jgi:hypothetical protein